MSEQNEQLLPCPLCGSADISLFGVPSFRFGHCDGCGTCGPTCTSATEAAAAWNRRAQPAPTVQAEPSRPTDLSKRLRQKAKHSDNGMVCLSVDDLRAAAEEIDRYYTGMLNWKRTAEAKDAAPAHASSDGRDAVLRMFERSAYPVATEIDPRGYRWSEAWLDEAYAALRALAGTGAKGGGS